ncbi:MAG TPA: SAM-dependent chlorinase/fluorinase [Gemmatimonadales bacterium]|nr:SAM-dependent chlorinase/fluorinase [Gemmatimonadales bacterium]
MAIITLLTDFGQSDSYVAEVKAVLLSQAGSVALVDITHQIAPGNVAEGQYLLGRSWRRFPQGTVHLAVVDPGVGTDRRAIAAEAEGHLFVAPDNGILSFLPPPPGAGFVLLRVPPDASPTFQARDVFAPAAARLARGASLLELGPRIADPYRSPLPTVRSDGVALVGAVIHVDRFGTLVTNIPGERVEPGVRILIEDVDCGPLRRTFGDVERGKLVAYIGSDGLVEVAVRDGNAARQLGVGVGTGVRA